MILQRLALLLVVGTSVTGCSDAYLVRKAWSSYEYRNTSYEHKCVDIPQPKGPIDCPKDRDSLRVDFNTIDAVQNAALKGPLSKYARAELKRIAQKP